MQDSLDPRQIGWIEGADTCTPERALWWLCRSTVKSLLKLFAVTSKRFGKGFFLLHKLYENSKIFGAWDTKTSKSVITADISAVVTIPCTKFLPCFLSDICSIETGIRRGLQRGSGRSSLYACHHGVLLFAVWHVVKSFESSVAFSNCSLNVTMFYVVSLWSALCIADVSRCLCFPSCKIVLLFVQGSITQVWDSRNNQLLRYIKYFLYFNNWLLIYEHKSDDYVFHSSGSAISNDEVMRNLGLTVYVNLIWSTLSMYCNKFNSQFPTCNVMLID